MSRRVLSETNEFFSPNICHVCKTEDNGNFITCDQCHMITYCSNFHRLIYKERHMQMCAAIQNVLRSHPHFWSTSGMNLEEWVQTRKQVIRLIKLQLQRDLEPYEVQMITLAKSCIICHRQRNLLHCLKCYSTNFCRNHKRLLAKGHRFTCENLKLSLWTNTDVALCPVVMDRFSEFPDENKYIVDMNAFIDEIVYPKNYMDETSSVWYSLCLYYSDYVSGPLTLYYGIRKINVLDALHRKPDSSFVIHIIDANFVDRKYVLAWELLLHLVPNIKNLKVILIGPALRTESEDLMVCTIRCVQQSLNFEAYRMLYHNYVDSECYKPPNVIIGFQVDFSDSETFQLESILKIKEQKLPLLLTSVSKHKAKQNINKINVVLKSPICNVEYLVYSGKNNFDSHRPYEDFDNSGVSYRNKYLTVYKRL